MGQVFLKSRVPTDSYGSPITKVVSAKEARSIHNNEWEALKRATPSVEMQVLITKAYALGRLHYSELK